MEPIEFKPNLKWGIGHRLLILILLFSSVVTLTLTAAQLYMDYRRDLSEIEQRLLEVRESNVDSLAASLWNMDRSLLQSQLSGIIRLPDMVSAAVEEKVSGVSSQLIISERKKGVKSHITREFPLITSEGSAKQNIGVLRVEATLSGVYRRLLDKAVVILASQGLKTFVVSFFILYVVYRLITRHLIHISHFVTRIDVRGRLTPLFLKREAPKDGDELEHVIMAFNSMQGNLETAYDQLRQANAELEMRVAERTQSLQDQIFEREAAERSLKESEERFRDIAEAASDWFWEMDADLAFTFISSRFYELTDLSSDDVIGRTRGELTEAGTLSINGDNGKSHWMQLDAKEPFHELDARLQDKSGKTLHIQIDGKPLFNDEGTFIGYRGAGRDVTIRKDAENAIKRSNEELEKLVEKRSAEVHKLSQAVEQSSVAVIITDTEGYIEYVNQALLDTTGYLPVEIMGQKSSVLRSDLTPPSTYQDLWEAIRSGHEWSGELLNKRKDGSSVWMQANIAPVRQTDGTITHYLAIEEDVTVRKAQEERILHQAQYDSLTDLPNRLLAVDRLNQAIKMSHRDQTMVALMFIDLDDFKKVNDTLGHEIGDTLLIEAAHRLNHAVREGDTVARQGGDEFLVILSGLTTAIDAEPVAKKILSAFATHFTIDGVDLVVTPSIGLSIYPNDGDDAATLLRNADAAMYRTKDEGRNGYNFFTNSMNTEALWRLEVERQLRHALDKNELHLAYQPIVATSNREIVGVEALLRWENKTVGQIGPDQFIPIAEQTGIIVPIGKWVMDTACAQVADWNKKLGTNLKLAVNVSPRQFRNKSILHTISHALTAGLEAEQLEIEVTEGLLLRNHPETLELLHGTKEIGVHLSMDDFGTGYSSLSYLKTLPFDTMKVDRSFVAGIVDNPDDLALVTAAINMAKSLSLEIIGEGVETEEQFQILIDQGCDYVQGYLFSRPVPPKEFGALLKGQKNKTTT